jgi:Tfp pilus assembly protein PilP
VLGGTGGTRRWRGSGDAEQQAEDGEPDDRQTPSELEGFHIEAFRWRGDVTLTSAGSTLQDLAAAVMQLHRIARETSHA